MFTATGDLSACPYPFCLFADDTGFEPDSFKLHREPHRCRRPDRGCTWRSSSRLNTPIKNRQAHLDEMLAAFCTSTASAKERPALPPSTAPCATR